MRINKYIAHAGVASRRKAEELIKQGLVTVNGQVVRELATTIKSGDKVEVEGQPIYNEEKVYYLLNKPRGVISSVSDDKGRPTVIDLLPQVKERIYPVGRLDWEDVYKRQVRTLLGASGQRPSEAKVQQVYRQILNQQKASLNTKKK